MSEVAGDRVDGSLLSIERDGGVGAVGRIDPERRVKTRAQTVSPGTPGIPPVHPEVVEQICTVRGRLERVRLHFAERDRSFAERTVQPLHRVAAIFPALIREPVPGRVDIFEQTVTVGVAEVAHPFQRSNGVREQGAHVVVGHAPSPRVMQQAQPEGGRVDGAVVQRRKREPEARRLESVSA